MLKIYNKICNALLALNFINTILKLTQIISQSIFYYFLCSSKIKPALPD